MAKNSNTNNTEVTMKDFIEAIENFNSMMCNLIDETKWAIPGIMGCWLGEEDSVLLYIEEAIHNSNKRTCSISELKELEERWEKLSESSEVKAVNTVKLEKIDFSKKENLEALIHFMYNFRWCDTAAPYSDYPEKCFEIPEFCYAYYNIYYMAICERVGDKDEFDPKKGLLSNYDFWINYMSDYSYELFNQIIPEHFGEEAVDYASAIEKALEISAEQVDKICISGGVDSFFDDNPELLAEILKQNLSEEARKFFNEFCVA